MSQGERYDTWRRMRDGDISIIVGARSALFAPFPDLGLIVMDEEEDTSYKQGRIPYYHTRETATQLARLSGALLIMGSAAPSLGILQPGACRCIPVVSITATGDRAPAAPGRLAARSAPARKPAIELLKMPRKQSTIPLPLVRVVDMRAELKIG